MYVPNESICTGIIHKPNILIGTFHLTVVLCNRPFVIYDVEGNLHEFISCL